MTYKTQLKYPGSKDRTPEGCSSWKEAINQVDGNLKWSLQFLSLEQVVAKAVKAYYKLEMNQSHSKVEERALYLLKLKQAFKESRGAVEDELDRIRTIEEVDLEELEEGEINDLFR